MKNKIKIIIIALIVLSLTAGCASGAVESSSSDSATSITGGSDTIIPDNVDFTDIGDIGGVTTTIAFSGSSAEIVGDGAALKDGIVTITKGGTYTLSGSFNGGVVITVPSTDKVQLILDGVDISAERNAAIYCTQADLLVINTAKGSTNTVTDSINYTYNDATAEEPDATIFSKTDLTFTGTGTLIVVAHFNNGIGTKDDLVITSGTFEITAKNHGIRGRDSLTIVDGDFNITAGADGLQSNNDEDTNKGWILLQNGVYNITAGNDAIQSETALSIKSGTYTLVTGGGNAGSSLDSTGSYKGIKSVTNMAISGGTFTIDSADDGVHANGNIAISGGAFTISSGDDGVHADGDLTISGADTGIDILVSYEGLESKTMTIASGTINITASDDGINVAGGNDTGADGGFGKDRFSSSNSEQWLLISGGTITVKAGADAIDINGSGEMTGGVVDLTAAMLGEGETVDVDGTWTKTGGELTETGGNSPGGPGGGGMGGDPGRPPR